MDTFRRSAADTTEIQDKIKAMVGEINSAISKTVAIDVDQQKATFEKVKNDLIEQERNARKRLEEDIAELHLTQVLKSIEEENKYREAKEQERIIDEKKKRLAMLKELSKESKKEREREERELERKKKKAEGEKLTKEDILAGIKDGFGEAFESHFSEFKEAVGDPAKHVGEVLGENLHKTIKGVGKAIEDGLNVINQSITKYAQYQTAINTRLQGISDFSKVSKTLGKVAFSPLINADNLYSNLNELVGEGVAFNVEQRAFLMTIKDSIATTFDANADYMKRMIRIQQEDSTASRLGMESYLTRWLNEYVKNTEYLTSTFDNVASSLFEASALLKKAGESGLSEEFEYIVQKWLGALTGVGLSESTAGEIASAIGALGSGDVSGLGSGIYNLMTMAASRSGLSLGSILNTGMSGNEVNQLLYGMTAFLQDIGSSSSNVVKNQLAKTFGVAVSDLVAASNLDNELDTIYRNMMSRNDMYSELNKQMGSVKERMGIANILENLFSNFTFQTGMNIAANPATYALWKITDMIQGVTGGINIPFVSAFGNGFDLNTTVENLMKLGIVGVSTFSNIGQIVNGLGSIGDATTLLRALEINSGNTAVSRGSGISEYVGTGAARKRISSVTRSESKYIGEESSSAYKEASLAAAQDEVASNTEADDPSKKGITETYLNEILYTGENSIGRLVQSIDGGIKAIRDNGVSVSNFGEGASSTISGFYNARTSS